LARQIQVFGRVIPTAETVGKINAVTIADIEAAAGKLFRAAPTLATMGPADRVPPIAEIVGRLAA
jgi:predicted Zn-dependent peptidase